MTLAQTVAPVQVPPVEYSALAPLLVLVGGALLLLAVRSLVPGRLPAGTYGLYTLAVSAGSLVSAGALWQQVREEGVRYAVAGAVVVDGFGVFLTIVVASALGLTALLADPYVRREGIDGPELYVLAMLSAAGAMVMAVANDLVVLFLGLEILSIALYVLAGFHPRRDESREAAIKYFVLGSFASAVLLYGIALVYGATGATALPDIARWLAEEVPAGRGVLLGGMALMLVGLGFKVAAVPFHAWTPDVYQGSPTPVTAFMAAVAKAAGFAALLRVFFSTFATLRLEWQPLVWVLAVLTLVVGSVLAVVQTDVKRMLAYSSISHAGYVLVGLQAANPAGVAGSLFYLMAYSFMALGSFGVVTVVSRRGDVGHSLDDYRGLAARRPGLALAFTVLLLAQAGVPLTSGFLAKLYVIAAVVESGSYALAVVAMLAAAVAGFFYLRLVLTMYSPRADGDAPAGPVPVPLMAGAALVVTLVFTVVVGLVPSPVVDFARQATLP